MLVLIIIILLVLGTVILLTIALFPTAVERLTKYQEKKKKEVDKELDRMFYEVSRKQVANLYYISPLACGIVIFIVTQSIFFASLAALAGLITIPTFVLKVKESRRRQKFNFQILAAVGMLSSSLKGGLSLLQAIETLVEEMPPPISQEFGLVLRENKMGRTLEQSLEHLNKRMNMEELELVINSVLVAKETGGDLTKVLGRLSITIRDTRKLKENIKTLTLQGKLQGIVMSVLPFLFVWWVLSFNREHFDIMLNTDTGRMLLILAVVLQIVGMFLIRKFSIIKW